MNGLLGGGCKVAGQVMREMKANGCWNRCLRSREVVLNAGSTVRLANESDLREKMGWGRKVGKAAQSLAQE